ncbi:MAG: hypothetical protein PSV35_01480 [bacterium]|nr:hypothetical protein [bacterium]
MLAMTNQLFCYWLQGYFEIGINVTLHKEVVILIKKQLDVMEEPLGQFPSWLNDVCVYIEKLNYREELCVHFSPLIQRSLNSVFYHVIDNSYTTEQSKEELQLIHDGTTHD